MNSEKKRLISYEANTKGFLDKFGVGQGNSMFMTITFRNNLTDKKLAGKAFDHLKKYISNTRQRESFLDSNYPNYDLERRNKMANLQESKFNYVCVWERQKRGAWHAHLLVNLPNWGTKNLKNFMRWICAKIYQNESQRVEYTQTEFKPTVLTFKEFQKIRGDRKKATELIKSQVTTKTEANENYTFGFIDVKWTFTFGKNGKRVTDIERPYEGCSQSVINRWNKAVNSAKKYVLKYILKQRGDRRTKGCRLISFSSKGGFKKWSSNFAFNTKSYQNIRLVLHFVNRCCKITGFNFESLYWRMKVKDRFKVSELFFSGHLKRLAEFIISQYQLHMGNYRNCSTLDIWYQDLAGQFIQYTRGN